VSHSALSKHARLHEMNLEPAKEYLTLFEFKCPHSRIPDHTIPEHYRPQITIGMNIIDIMELGIFIQAVYRRCTFKDIAYNRQHNGMGHFKRASTQGDPKETGFMVMHCADADYVSDLIEYLESDSNTKLIEGVIDIGSICDKDAFEEIMRECVSKRIKVDYSFREEYCSRVFEADGMTQAFYNTSLQYRSMKALRSATDRYRSTIVGVLPYKMLDVYITPVTKDPTYIESSGAMNRAKLVIDCINDHRKLANPVKAEVAKSVRAYKL
jgi:hypothetical protein